MDELDRKVERANKVLGLLTEGTITPKEMKEFLELVLGVIKKSKQNFDTTAEENLQKIEETRKYIDTAYVGMTKDFKLKLENIKGELDQKYQEILSKKPEDGVDGVSPDASLIVQEVIRTVEQNLTPLIPTKEELTKDLNGGEVVDMINHLPLKPEDQIGAEHIKDLKKFFDEWAKKLNFSGSYGGIGGSAGGGRTVKIYSLSSQLNGVLKTFSLPAFWRILSIHSTSFPNSAFELTTDYTVDGAAMTITFTSAIDAATVLATGQTLIIEYAE